MDFALTQLIHMNTQVGRLLALLCFVTLAACSDNAESTTDPRDVAQEGPSDTSAETDSDAQDIAEDPPGDVNDPEDGSETSQSDGSGEEDVAARECNEGERLVAGRCRDAFDRVCETTDDCLADEVCVPEEPLGRCTYTPGPVTVCPGDDGCESGEGVLRAAFAAVDITLPGFEVARDGYGEEPNEFGDPERFVGDVQDVTTFCDCGLDMICPPTEDYSGCPSVGDYVGPDADGTEEDGFMQAAWVAGFSNSRLAALCPEEWLADDCEGPRCCDREVAHDPLWVRVIVLDRGDVRHALVSIDTVGYFYSDQLRNAAALDPAWGIDFLTVTATHNHEAPDTMGQWGTGPFGSPLPTETGVMPQFMERIEAAIVQGVGQAVTDLAPVDVYAAHLNTGADGFAARDSRDPFVFDDRVTALRFVVAGEEPTADSTIGSLLNWHSHPESLGGGNVYLTSDFPHFYRSYVERGIPTAETDTETGREYPARLALGGTAIYLSGAVGGLLNPLRLAAIDRDGTAYAEQGFEKAHALGVRLADVTIEAFDTACDSPGDTNCATLLEDTSLSFAHRELMLPIENIQFQIAGISLGIFDRRIFNWRESDRLGFFSTRVPELRTLVSQLRLGIVTFQSFPGEVFPEAITGWQPGQTYRDPILGNPDDTNCAEDRLTRLEDGDEPRFPCLNSASNPNPPDLTLWGDERPLAAELPGEYLVILGLANDALGYLVPTYDFKVDPAANVLAEV
ncbi:MAG: hypothetical protein ACJA1R_003145, partial [Flavobacteriales bacterium]